MIVRQAGELKVRSSSDREAAALRADLDFARLPQPRSAMRFEGETWPSNGEDGPMTHALLFEIWEDPDSSGFEMSMVTRRGDELRAKIAPASVLRHSYRARSTFEAFRMKNDWLGFEPWRPDPEWTDQLFAAEDVAEQNSYLAVRVG